MKFKILALFVVSTIGFGQETAGYMDPHVAPPTSTGLSGRLMASDNVIVGTVTKVDTVNSLTAEEMQKLFANKTYNQETRGDRAWRWTIQVVSTLCRNVDFRQGAANAPNLSSEIYLVRPLSEAQSVGSQRTEFLEVGKKYLFLMKEDPQQSQNIEKFHLDPKQRYYRTVGYADGAIELPKDGLSAKERFTPSGYRSAEDRDIATPVLKAATALCAAVRPSQMFQKQIALELLKSSSDSTMRENAEFLLKQLAGDGQVGK